MSERRPLVAANWKMNGTLASIRPLVAEVLAGAPAQGADVALCVPSPYLSEMNALLKGSAVMLGAQTVSEYESGAYTGEVSAAMLNDYNCRLVIVGHSERRRLYGESDQIVAEKFARAIAAGIDPVLCVGEMLDQRQSGDTEDVLAGQLDAVLDRSGIEAMSAAVIAYEPVWAIGTGLTATPEQAQDAHAFIRSRLAQHDGRVAAGVRILYGGSVKPDNAAALFQQADVDGGLIGGASLVARDFIEICNAAR